MGGGGAAVANVDKPSKQWLLKNMESVAHRKKLMFAAFTKASEMIVGARAPWNFLTLP